MASTMSTQKKPSTSKDVPWFKPEIAQIDPAFQELMEGYSKIPADSVKSHILAVREKAWQTFPYPCIGQFNFLALSITCHSCYPRVLSALSTSGSKVTLLDLGCCFAQDLRKLVHDSAMAENLYACDLEYGFIELGYELFADRDTLKAHFLAADIFEDDGSLRGLEGKMDFIHTGSFLHLFSRRDQVRACERMIKLLKPCEGSTVFGRQMGNTNGQEVANKIQGGTMFQHDPETFKQMWQEVSERTGTSWHVEVGLDSAEGMDQLHWTGEGCRRLKFEVTRRR